MATRVHTSKDFLDAKFGEISKRLDEHTTEMREHVAEDRRMFNAVLVKLDEHNLRVDRIEQKESRREWHVKTLWVAVLAAIGGLLASAFK